MSWTGIFRAGPGFFWAGRYVMGLSASSALPGLEKTMRRPRRNHSPQFKAKVALAVLPGEKIRIEVGEPFDVHPNPITR
jgi:hypothetical protein